MYGLSPLLQILDRYVERLSFGVRQELLPLMELDGVKQFRARALYDAGFCSIQTIAHARPDDLLKARLGAFFSKQYTHPPLILCLSFFGLSLVYYCQTCLYLFTFMLFSSLSPSLSLSVCVVLLSSACCRAAKQIIGAAKRLLEKKALELRRAAEELLLLEPTNVP